MFVSLILAIFSSIILFGVGYIIGHKSGEQAREELQEQIEHLQNQISELKVRERELELSDKIESLIKNREEESNRLVEKFLEPLLGKERLGEELIKIRDQISSRHNLPEVLELIGKTGGFLSILLCDSTGLPLASSGNFERGGFLQETLAGLSSMLIMLSDKFHQVGAVHPKEIILSDQQEQILMNRILKIDGEQYLLMALSQGRLVWPGMLDPVAPIVEEILSKDDWKVTLPPRDEM